MVDGEGLTSRRHGQGFNNLALSRRQADVGGPNSGIGEFIRAGGVGHANHDEPLGAVTPVTVMSTWPADSGCVQVTPVARAAAIKADRGLVSRFMLTLPFDV